MKKQYKNVRCDICLEEQEIPENIINESKIIHRKGIFYMSGIMGNEISVNLCEKCFNEKLIPWLKGFGIVVNKKPINT